MSILSEPDKSHRHRPPICYNGPVEETTHPDEWSMDPCALRLDPCALAPWLDEMACHPLPGGVAAAAVGAAMGAALVVKAARLALSHGLDLPGRAEMEALAGRAHQQAMELLELADADTQAYRSVLHTRRLAGQEPARQQAWQAATEVPLRLAELCAPLEEFVPALLDRCPPVVRLELQVGGWLLHAASRAGRLAAEVNLGMCGECDETGSLRVRLAALEEGSRD